MAESDMRRPVLLDTDIGTDVDDLLALALLVGAPEVQLIGVTTVYGDTVLRARMTRLVLDQMERRAVPIGIGARETLSRQAGLVGRARGSRHSRARSGADR